MVNDIRGYRHETKLQRELLDEGVAEGHASKLLKNRAHCCKNWIGGNSKNGCRDAYSKVTSVQPQKFI